MKIKVISPNTQHAEVWAAALKFGMTGDQVETVVRPLRSVNVIVNGSRPDLVLAEAVDEPDFVVVEALANAHPDVDFVLVSPDLKPELLVRAMRAGIREVLPAPATAEAVLGAAQRLSRKRVVAKAPVLNKADGEVLAFISCKGGSGATFTAANLAHLLSQNGKRRVALIDLNLQFGDAHWFISSEPATSNVADVARNIARLDRDLLKAAMTQVFPGLWVLAAPDDPAHSTDVTPEHVEAIIEVARTMFDHVVIDAGRALSSVTLAALDQADFVFPVLQLTLPYIRDGKRLRQVFLSLGYKSSKVQWIVNRHDKRSQITLDDLKRTLELRQVITLPNQYDAVAASVNQGLPVAKIAPSSAITRSLQELADRLAPPPKDEAGSGRSGGWLGSLLPGMRRSDAVDSVPLTRPASLERR